MPGTPERGGPETILAFDYGRKRIGVAVGQQVTGSAGPLGVVVNGAEGPDWSRISSLVAEWTPARLVVGMPLHADGSPGVMTASVDAFVGELRRYSLPVETIDERYSSLEARQILIEGRKLGQSKRVRREMVDAAAAVLIAERWLARDSAESAAPDGGRQDDRGPAANRD